MPPRRTRNINDIYERIMARIEERLDQFVDQFANRMNDMMNLRRCKDRNGQRSEDEELGNPFFEGDCSSSNEWGDYGVAGNDYEGAPVFDDDYEEAPVFNDDQFEEESMSVYDIDIEDAIEEEEGFVGKGGFGEEEENIEDVVVVANDLCSSMIQTTLSVNFSKTIDSNPHELIWSQKVSLEDRVDPDVNDDTSEDEPTSSKQKWFSHLTVSNKGKFLVLVNGITLKKLIRKGISSVLKPKVCLSGAAKKKSIVPDIVNKCKQARHVEV
ncbi:hypothetical protein Tco_1402492 [Tanacetum coccineum]